MAKKKKDLKYYREKYLYPALVIGLFIIMGVALMIILDQVFYGTIYI
jgi:hypothetical protein